MLDVDMLEILSQAAAVDQMRLHQCEPWATFLQIKKHSAQSLVARNGQVTSHHTRVVSQEWSELEH
jgi:hypothetical protein